MGFIVLRKYVKAHYAEKTRINVLLLKFRYKLTS